MCFVYDAVVIMANAPGSVTTASNAPINPTSTPPIAGSTTCISTGAPGVSAHEKRLHVADDDLAGVQAARHDEPQRTNALNIDGRELR
jgi:hypothetical protein